MIFDDLANDLDRKMKEIELTSDNIKAIKVTCEYNNSIPEYNSIDYARIANKEINKLVVLPASRKNHEGKYFITTINKIPRSIQQRIGGGSVSSWINMVMIYNFFANEYGYAKIGTKKETIKPLRMYDRKDSGSSYSYSYDKMVYISDGMYIHEDDCWW